MLFAIIAEHIWYVGGKPNPHDPGFPRSFQDSEIVTFLEDFLSEGYADDWCAENSSRSIAWGQESWVYRRWDADAFVEVATPTGETVVSYDPESWEGRYIEQTAESMRLARS